MTDERSAISQAVHPIWAILEEAERGLEIAAGRLRTLRAELARLDLPQRVQLNCPACGIRLTSPVALDDHLWNKHGIGSEEGGGPEQHL